MASSMLTKLFTVASVVGYLFLASVPMPVAANASPEARFRPPLPRDTDNFRPPQPRDTDKFRPPLPREAAPEARLRPPLPRHVHAEIARGLAKRAKTETKSNGSQVRTNANSKRCKVKVVSSSSKSAAASKTSSAAHGRVTVSVGGGISIGVGGGSNGGGGNSGSGDGGDNNNNNNNGGGDVAPPTHYSPKLGLVFGGDPSQLSSYGAHQNRRLYNWSPQPPYNAKSLGFNFMPMLWGEKNVGSGCQWNGGCFSDVKASDYNTVMFINEANERGQANMGVGRAVQLWHQYMQPLANQGVKTVGPVMSSNPNGKVWTKQFFAQCKGCTVTYQPVHYYDVTAKGMIQYIKDYHELSGNKPIMVTEWACQNYNGGAQCTKDEIWAFNKEVIDFMDSTSWVVSYMPFGVMMGPLPDNVNQQNILMNGDGNPTPLAHLMGY